MMTRVQWTLVDGENQDLADDQFGNAIEQSKEGKISRIRGKGVNLSWEDINVFVTRSNKKCFGFLGGNEDKEDVLQILKNISGEIKAGSLVALMGSSGAGKSTLLNVLSHRNISAVNVTGTVFLNGSPVRQEINTMSAYVQQEDLFIGTLTVREHLMFQALLRMDKNIPQSERVRRVEKAITELGLAKCSETLIGIPGRLRGISGGEKKRLSFASEILTDPPLLFVDEPTSGLDSFMAQTVVATLQNLAHHGMTILSTIHQPSSEVYQMFDNLILLANGRLAYVGPREEAIPYFERINYPCPVNYNPADYFVYILAFIPEKEEESKERIKFICDKHDEWEGSNIKKKPLNERVNSFETTVVSGSRYQASWLKQFFVLFHRAMLSAKRDKMVSVIRIMQSLILGIVVGLIYLRLSYNQENIQNFAGLLFFIVTNLSFASLQGVIFVFPVEVPVFLREHKSGMYRTDTYYLAKTMAEVPIFSIAAVILITISYWMANLREDAGAFFICVAIGVLIVNTAASYGYAISTMTSSVETATALGPVCMLPLLLFGGFFVNNDTVPDYFIWLRYLSWFNYGFENLMINQWEDYPGMIACERNNTASCDTTGEMVLKRFQLHEENFYPNLYYIIALMISFRIISFVMLYVRARRLT
ncbi:protein white-like isoform X2 [Xenia sp. Carnegie-2017]|uniref:protein white-like isoform X2 n=1 Tax=Xenia sp. Carnegie-2017 TaxID=2897299 RepID=UPI001F04825A|nr:protein white-like isoform X2 [Xenia sp. Carnegie-2017]